MAQFIKIDHVNRRQGADYKSAAYGIVNMLMWLNSLRLTMSIAGRALITNQLLMV
ncbi:MAG: hypothetical protein QM793_06145 [Muricomes sp.]